MAGAILFNGNAETEGHLVRGAAPLLLSSRHRDPEVASSRRVVLVTAGWSDREHDEGHVKHAINEKGLSSRHEGGFDTTLVNLSLLQELYGFTRAAPHLAEAWLELRRVVETARSFYLELDPRRATSVGEEDGVYVFDPDGRKLCCRSGEAIPV